VTASGPTELAAGTGLGGAGLATPVLFGVSATVFPEFGAELGSAFD
jgi:hypothetical protein